MPAQGGQTGQAAYGQTGQAAYGQTGQPGIRPAWSVAVRAGVRQRLRELSGDSEEEVARRLVDRRWRAGHRHHRGRRTCHPSRYRRQHRYHRGPGAALAGRLPGRSTASPEPNSSHPADGRVHGGPVSYPMLGNPWGAPQGDNRVPFGSDVQSQLVPVETDYDGNGSNWVASVLVGELQAGDGFFTPEQGSQIVVKCILGKFYGDNPVKSNVTVNKATNIDGHDAWLVESKLTFDIAGLQTKGELLIVAIVSAGNRSGLYYASIPDTTPELVEPARDALKNLKVDG